MTLGRLLRRSLVYHRGIHLAVALGVAAGAAVLTGALIVGDSVRGSLRGLTLERLGRIDHALVADRYFSQSLAGAMPGEAAPAILIRGSAEAPESGARSNRVNILGVDGRFWSFYAFEPLELGLRDVALNESLARELAVEQGGAVLLRFQTDTLVPAESVMGRKTDNVRTLRMQVAAVLPDRGPARFGLSPSQQLPLNVFMALGALDRALEQPGRANGLLLASEDSAEEAAAAFAGAASLEDFELLVQPLADVGVVSVSTSRIVLEDAAAEAALAAAGALGLEAAETLTYVANEMRIGESAIPYSTVTALGGAPDIVLINGEPAPKLRNNEILLNDWAADDLAAKPGDALAMTYYTVGPQGELKTATHEFQVAGVVRLQGLAADRDLAPEFKGMSDVDRMSDWDPPFPVDLNRIRSIDEDYWDRYRTAPKAFVALDTAKQLWASRFGTLTSIRVTPKQGQDVEDAAEEFAAALRERLDPAAFGLAFQPVKEQGLEAARGATDFAGLFLGFSMFLIGSAAMLVALLFQLGVERRSKEIGLLLATGQPVSAVRKLLLGEGAAVTGFGCLLGVPGAAAYGGLMVYGLRTWWSAAVGGLFLELHVSATSLLIGLVAAFALMIGAIWLAIRRLERLSPRALLAGSFDDSQTLGGDRGRALRPRIVAIVSAAAAVLLLGLALVARILPPSIGFFAVAGLLLISALAYFYSRLIAPSRTPIHPSSKAPLARLGARNGARFPVRSLLAASLVACATFVIVAVAANRVDVTSQEPEFASGDGGFRFVAESDLPLHGGQIEEADLEDGKIFPLRLKRGEDASCLNLYRPSQPSLAGAPPSLIARGGFAFQASLAEDQGERANPWLLLEKEFGDGAIPVIGDANSVLWILHLGLGDRLEVQDERGRKRTLVIAGLLSRSIFQSELIMAEPRFLEMFPGHSGYHQFLIETGDPEAGRGLEERWAELGFDATATADRLAGFLVVENTYLSTFQTLGGLGLLLGTFGLAVVMVRNVIERRSELALLQAVGFSRGAVSRLVLAENGFLLVLGVAIGTAAALLAVLPHLLSSVAQPPWASLALILAGVLAAGLTAGALAVRATLKQALLPALRRD